MKTLADNFSAVFPRFAATEFHGTCVIIETKNHDTKCFQELQLTGFDGYLFPQDLGQNSSSFAQISNHNGILRKDCDGIILFEKNGQKYLLFCELKSSYVLEDIKKAKDQIIGTSVKMKGICSTLQGYDLNEYKPLGLIASFEPTDEQISNISKSEDKGASFAIQLNANKIYSMPSDKCNRFFHPLEIGDFVIYYIPVPGHATNYSVDINTVLQGGSSTP